MKLAAIAIVAALALAACEANEPTLTTSRDPSSSSVDAGERAMIASLAHTSVANLVVGVSPEKINELCEAVESVGYKASALIFLESVSAEGYGRNGEAAEARELFTEYMADEYRELCR